MAYQTLKLALMFIPTHETFELTPQLDLQSPSGQLQRENKTKQINLTTFPYARLPFYLVEQEVLVFTCYVYRLL